MRLIKIGSSPSCDLVLQSEFVSSHHAEMILLDNGDIILEDKNSTNGTYVGNKKLSPNKELNVKRGDYVKFADVELNWTQIPIIHIDNSKYKTIVNIGTSFRNDLVISGNYPSRFHATLKVDKEGKAFICDSNSKNGTKVNGVKLQPNKDVRIKKGDIVICGDVDITEQIASYIPDNFAILKRVGIGTGVLGVLALLAFIIWKLFSPSINPGDLRPAVVYVNIHFKYDITLKDNPIRDVFPSFELPEIQYGSGTAFFVDKEGRMATNRHIAVPWEHLKELQSEYIDEQVKETLERLIPVKRVFGNSERMKIQLQILQSTDIGRKLCEHCTTIEQLNKILDKIFNSEYTVSGHLVDLLVAYPGRHYVYLDEFDRCDVLRYSNNPEKDIALLQLNSKVTPAHIKKVFEVKKFNTKPLEPLKDKLYTIGYPNGTVWALDKSIKSLEPAIRETMCSKRPGKYDFEFQGESIGGASGSPIFNGKGELVGILYGSLAAGVTYGKACQARFLKEMYEEEVGL